MNTFRHLVQSETSVLNMLSSAGVNFWREEKVIGKILFLFWEVLFERNGKINERLEFLFVVKGMKQVNRLTSKSIQILSSFSLSKEPFKNF